MVQENWLHTVRVPGTTNLGTGQAQTCLMPTQKGNRDLGGLHEADRTSGGEAAEETQPARHSSSCNALSG